MRWLALAAALAAPQAVSAQLAERVREVDDGTVRFAYETKPGVEICAEGVRIGEHRMHWRAYGEDDDRGRDCRMGVAEVELRVRGGAVRDVALVRDLDERRAGAVDLGEVGADEAARYLLSLAYDGATRDAAEDAMMPAMLADATDVWRPLLDIAQDRDVPEDVRRSATFWLGQEAAAAAGEGLGDLARDESEDQEIRNAAIFALSQRPDDEAVPTLMEIARTGREAETRRTAMFWLAQSDDERVVAFFEQILLGRIR